MKHDRLLFELAKIPHDYELRKVLLMPEGPEQVKAYGELMESRKIQPNDSEEVKQAKIAKYHELTNGLRTNAEADKVIRDARYRRYVENFEFVNDTLI